MRSRRAGRSGYDHKKMGITARGAWEAVKRHFRELDRDIQREPFTAVGVGDMSGDVFGNGMLLSKQTRLIAAFDHRDIFVDPNPDPAASHAERTRLFALPRSSWQDYDKTKLSRGGGIFSRAEKSVPLSAEARMALNLSPGELTPTDVMRAILKADVDLLFFGGIGTYIRASTETEAQAGDKANDAVRITGSDVRAKVIGEGANLAMTQRGRIEYALRGGKLNTDAIDNSAGVNSSDLEVNIKIALGSLTRAGTLDEKARVAFLASMTREVAALCLRNNYLQSLALSLAERDGLAALPSHISLMESLEARGLLSRDVEFLPTQRGAVARADTGTCADAAGACGAAGLCQEHARDRSAGLAGARRSLSRQGALPVLPGDAGRDLSRTRSSNHRLRREVIATVLANAMLNRGGPSFVDDMVRTTSADAGQVASAYAAARDVYGLMELNAEIDALDGKVTGELQLGLYAEVRNLVIKETLWFLRNTTGTEGLGTLIERYHEGVAAVRQLMAALLPKTASAATHGADQDASRWRRVARACGDDRGAADAVVRDRHRARGAADAGQRRRGERGVLRRHGALRARRDRRGGGAAGAGRPVRPHGARPGARPTSRGPSAISRSMSWRLPRSTVAERLAAWREARAAAVDRAIAAVTALTEGELTVSRLTVAAGLLVRPRAQCLKWRMPVKTMAMPAFVGGVDHGLVVHRAAGLDHGGGAGVDGFEQAVGEREEGVGGDG